MPFYFSILLSSVFTLLFIVCSGNSQKTDLRQLFQNYPQNQELTAYLGTRYEVVYPIQISQTRVRGLSTKKISSKTSRDHVSNTTFLVEARHFKIYLDLELNIDLLPPTLTQLLVSSSSRQLISEAVENCYYHATVRNYSDAYGAFRTCNGLSGVLYFENRVYVIHPLYGDHSSKQPHLLFHHYQNQEDQLKCGTGEGEDKYCLQERLYGAVNHLADISSEKKYVELALILDQAFFQMHNSPPEEVIANAIQMINCADVHYQFLNTSISLVRIELWTEDVVHMEPNVEENLRKLQQYVADGYIQGSTDAVHMLSGAEFNDSAIGVAEIDTICTWKALAITKVDNMYTTHVTSHIITHMLGHNLGMCHDSDSCNCPFDTGCQMSGVIQSTLPLHFSSCSVENYFRTLRNGYGACLFNMPMLRESICGNGILEKGEQCDCGSSEVCKDSDSCCDHVTCKFVKNAQCSSGPCCDRCKLRSSAFICRSDKGECDIPEYCDGRSGQCPLDVFKKNGILCAGGNGYCYQGNCSVINDQCTQLWGSGAKTANPICYQKLNVQGTPNGNCGFDPNRGYIKCTEENVYCGTLQCQQGQKVPFFSKSSVRFQVHRININGEKYECKAAPASSGDDDRLYGLVNDGTKCGYQSVCVNRTCINLMKSATGRCPKDSTSYLPCSGHGVCTNIHTCYCYEEWTGHDCSQKSGEEITETVSETDVVSHSVNDRHGYTVEMKTSSSGTNLAATVVATSVIIGIALVICFTLLFIHRKTKLRSV